MKDVTYKDIATIPLDTEIWFDTGLKMGDGKTPRTMVATNQADYDKYISRNWKPLSKGSLPPTPGKVVKGVTKLKKKG